MSVEPPGWTTSLHIREQIESNVAAKATRIHWIFGSVIYQEEVDRPRHGSCTVELNRRIHAGAAKNGARALLRDVITRLELEDWRRLEDTAFELHNNQPAHEQAP